MADQVDSMSDAELRTKLAEHGFPIMPITASTRKLLVKKLKLALGNKLKSRNHVDYKVKSTRKDLAMADQVDSMSDAELRTTLAEHGINLKLVLDINMKPRNSVDNMIESRQKDLSVADQVDLMSNAELQMKLAEHGFPIMPITASTRKLMVKMLKLVLGTKKKPRTSVVDKQRKRPGTREGRGIRKILPAASEPSGSKPTTQTKRRNQCSQ